jgi:hypothetical protein
MIDYNKPWHVLKVDMANALHSEFDAEKFRAESDQANKSIGIWSLRKDEMVKVVNEQWLNYLASCGIEASSCLIFYRDAYLVYPEAHVDLRYGDERPNIFALNWVFSPNDDSYMTWYNVPNETGTLHVTPADTKYRYWKLEEVKHKEITRHTIGNKLTMVRTGIAHNVIVNKQPRWLISLRFKSGIDNPNYHDWKSAVDYYAQTLKLINS